MAKRLKKSSAPILKAAVRNQTPPAPTKIHFHYIKSNFFRVVYAQGAMGSVTAQGKIYFSLYNERAAMPRATVHDVTPAGTLGEIVEAEGKSGFVRELEVGVLMDRDEATNFRNWLSQRIEQLEKASNKKRSTKE